MINLNFRSQGLMIALPLTMFVFSSGSAVAGVYKWSNARGVTQYAGSRAVPNATKATPNEIVNALQAKDVCTSASPSIKVNPSLSIASASGAISDMLVSLNFPTKFDQYKAAINASLKSTIAAIPNIFVSDAVATTEIVQVGLMPAVNISADITPVIGYSDLRLRPTTEIGPFTGGAYRVVCTPSHMSNDDPVVYPNQQGAAHHHTFFGNTSVNYKSDLMTLSNTGNSTCKGGILNRSAYWIPSMIDTTTNTPVAPNKTIIYYKTGYVPANLITVPPKGLRMIAGNSKATTEALSDNAYYTCAGRTPFYGWKKSIPACNVGENMAMVVKFPQCWDGKNLDSPDHKSHMAYSSRILTTANKCPQSHPVGIPLISFNFDFKVTSIDSNKIWRLASDNYTKDLPGGLSGHGDWVNGWDQALLTTIVKNCLNKGVDCHASLLGDGRQSY